MIKTDHGHKLRLIITCVLQILLAIVTGLIYLLSQNTLQNNGKWLSTKMGLGMNVLAARNYFSGRQALAKCRLNLGAWHGYQEVIYKSGVNPQRIEFDFFLTDDSYFYFVLNKNADKFSGIRISINDAFSSMYFTAHDSGEFTDKRKVAVNTVERGKWNHVKATFIENGFYLFINGNLTGNFRETLLDKQNFGFRGSSRRVLIDNIFVQLKDPGGVIRENFFNTAEWAKILITALTGIILLNAGILFFLVFRKKPILEILSNITAVNVLSLSILVSWLMIDFLLLSDRYPNPEGLFSKIRRQERSWVTREAESINRSIMEEYTDRQDD